MRSKSKPRVAKPAAEPVPEHRASAAFRQSPWRFVLVSLVVLLPCYWQPRIEAGDLASHIYNAWLAQLIQSGRIHGLEIESQTTNVLFDLILGALLPILGADWAQRIAVSLAVLIFVWGAFAFAREVSGREPWLVMPPIAILAYGWVYHMGFFNFYLSMGMCLWVLALLWQPTARRVAASIPILLLAYLAHGLPVAWGAGLAAYIVIARRLAEKQRMYLMAGAVAAIVLARMVVSSAFPTVWDPAQLTLITGLDQSFVFDGKYFAVMIGLLFIWAVWFLGLTREKGGREVVRSIPFQICVISATAVFLVPSAITLPGYQNALAYVAQRMSLAAGICFCVLLANVRPTRFGATPMAVMTVVFFAFLFHDERALNVFEARLQQMSAALPDGQRVLSALDDPTSHVGMAHLIDRACIGHCFSYANYEPSTLQFRVRVRQANPYVAPTYGDSWLMQTGGYVVKESDLPLYQIDVNGSGHMVVKSLQAGMRCGTTPVRVLGDLL